MITFSISAIVAYYGAEKLTLIHGNNLVKESEGGGKDAKINDGPRFCKDHVTITGRFSFAKTKN